MTVEVFRHEKPNTDAVMGRVLQLLAEGRTDIAESVSNANTPEYLFWDKVRYKLRPEGLTAEEYWAFVKLSRRIAFGRMKTIVKDEKGQTFSWQPFYGLDMFLHEVDMRLGGTLAASQPDEPEMRRRFLTRGIMEEAIASSQLEGANTTRKAAKAMLMEQRRPRNRSEQMILNNHRTMLAVEHDLKGRPMTIDMLLDIHVMLVKDTADAGDIGRLRRAREDVVVCDPVTNVIYHIPPSVKFLKQEMKRLISYANDEADKHQFVHPLIKAIILHFWIGYLHPFVDGNGRLARTLFYWYLLRHNYWAFSYLPISRVIKNSPAQYRDAYVYTEQDDNDLTYFIDYNVRKISQARREFEDYVKRKEDENRRMAAGAREKYHLNDRQIQLLRYLHKNADATTSIRTHSQVNGVSRLTARKDLEQLEQIGFLSSQKIGRDRPFKATDRTAELF
jgi:Fic family protein